MLADPTQMTTSILLGMYQKLDQGYSKLETDRWPCTRKAHESDPVCGFMASTPKNQYSNPLHIYLVRVYSLDEIQKGMNVNACGLIELAHLFWPG